LKGKKGDTLEEIRRRDASTKRVVYKVMGGGLSASSHSQEKNELTIVISHI